MLTQIAIAKKLTIPGDTAWEAIGKIGRLDVWFPSIATCRVEGDGADLEERSAEFLEALLIPKR